MSKSFATAALLVAMAAAAVVATRNPPPDATHVLARIEFDNTLESINKQIEKIRQYIAKELCVVPQGDVKILKVIDDSKKVMGIGDTQTLVYASCKAPLNKLEAVLDDCEDLWNRHQVKDELEDKTSWFSGGEVDVDDIDCTYVRANKFEFMEAEDARRAEKQGQGSTSTLANSASQTAAAIRSGAASTTAAAAVASTAAAAAVAALLL